MFLTLKSLNMAETQFNKRVVVRIYSKTEFHAILFVIIDKPHSIVIDCRKQVRWLTLPVFLVTSETYLRIRARIATTSKPKLIIRFARSNQLGFSFFLAIALRELDLFCCEIVAQSEIPLYIPDSVFFVRLPLRYNSVYFHLDKTLVNIRRNFLHKTTNLDCHSFRIA